MFDVAAPIDDKADLAANFRGQFRTHASKFGCHDLIDWDTPTVEMLKSQELTGFETMDVSENRRNLTSSVSWVREATRSCLVRAD